MDKEAILREKLEESKQKAIRFIAVANHPAVEQMIRTFEQNTKFTSFVDVVNDPDGYLFMKTLMRFCSKEIITRVGLNLPDGISIGRLSFSPSDSSVVFSWRNSARRSSY